MDRISAKIKDHLHQIFAFLSHNFFSRTSSLPSAHPKHRPIYQLLVAYQHSAGQAFINCPKCKFFHMLITASSQWPKVNAVFSHGCTWEKRKTKLSRRQKEEARNKDRAGIGVFAGIFHLLLLPRDTVLALSPPYGPVWHRGARGQAEGTNRPLPHEPVQGKPQKRTKPNRRKTSPIIAQIQVVEKCFPSSH